MQTEWRDLVDFPGYEVSNLGKVRNKITMKSLRMKMISKYPGYQFHLGHTKSDKGKNYQRTIHRLLAKAFIPNPEDKSEVNHIDSNKMNYAISNLEWVTQSENTLHSFKNGHKKLIGNENPQTKLTSDKVRAIVILLNSGGSMVEVRTNFQIGNTCIKNIMRGTTWSHITGINDPTWTNRHIPTAGEVLQILKLHNDGVGTIPISKTLGYSRATIMKTIRNSYD